MAIGPTSVAVPASPTAHLYRYRYMIVAGLALCYMMSTFHRAAGAAIAGDLTHAFGIDPVSLGLLTSLYFYPYAAVQVPIGIMADRLGVRLTVSLFVAMTAAGTLLLGLAPSYGWALVGRTLVGAGAGGIYVPAVRGLGTWFRKQELASYVGLMMAFGQIGSITGTGPLAAISQAIGWRPALVALGVLTLAFAAFSLVVLRNRPQELGLPALIVEADPRSVPLGAAIRTTLRNRDFRLLNVGYFFLGGAFLGFQGLWGGPFLTDVFGLSKVAAGTALAMIPVGMLIGCPLAGWLHDRVFRRRRPVLVSGVALFLAMWVVLTFGGQVVPPGAMYPVLFAFGIGLGFFTITYSQVVDLFPAEISGTALGLYNVLCFLGGGLFQQIIGLIVKAFPRVNGVYPPAAYRTGFLLCLVSVAITLVCVLAVREPAAT